MAVSYRCTAGLQFAPYQPVDCQAEPMAPSAPAPKIHPKPSDAIDAPDAGPCPATIFAGRQVATSRRVRRMVAKVFLAWPGWWAAVVAIGNALHLENFRGDSTQLDCSLVGLQQTGCGCANGMNACLFRSEPSPELAAFAGCESDTNQWLADSHLRSRRNLSELTACMATSRRVRRMVAKVFLAWPGW